MEGKILQTTKEIFSEGVQVTGAFSRRGDLFIADWIQAAIMEGRGFAANVGALSTPIVGGGNGTIIDLDQPEFGMIIPSGTTLVPIRLNLQLTTPLLATDEDEAEAVAYVDTTAATVTAALDGTWANTITPKNMKIAVSNALASNCTVKSVCSADTTDPTESIDLMHTIIRGDVQGTAANALWTKNELLYEPKNPPFIIGPASLFVHWGGTVAVYGFMQFFWLELPTVQVTS
jgi:hypothetical protein